MNIIGNKKGTYPRPPCPECTTEKRHKKLEYKHHTTEQWGPITTVHVYYYCRLCHSTFVSTNNTEPEITSL